MKRYITMALAALAFAHCTKLDEKLNGELGSGGVSSGNVTALLQGAYNSLRAPYQGPWGWWSLEEFPSDEAIAPTRGGDWDDNGAWRALHQHKWTAEHTRIHDTYRDISAVNYAATDLLRYNPSPAQAAEARFLRAYAQFTLLDGWNQVAYRDPGEDVTRPPRVRKGAEALDYIISELNDIMNALPDAPKTGATKDAARVLLMKCYLNKGAFLHRQAPAFEAADMNQVITLANTLISSGRYSLANNYFDNFAPNNHTLSNETIWTGQNTGGADGSTWIRELALASLHYNQKPSGYNGFATLSDFYNKFEASDSRRGGPYPGMTNVSGLRAGFLAGQQYDEKGTALKDRKGNNLSYTPELSIIERGHNLELTGIRVVKYPIDYQNVASTIMENDWVYFRLADVLLMKAEAILRGGASTESALSLVNGLRTKRGASLLPSVTLEVLLDERGREFFWEGTRRTDLIRFGKYLQPWQEKPSDDPRYLLFPIPANQLSNPNYEQNPGYEG